MSDDDVTNDVEDTCDVCGDWKDECVCQDAESLIYAHLKSESCVPQSNPSAPAVSCEEVVIHRWLVKYSEDDGSVYWKIVLADKNWPVKSKFAEYYDLGVDTTYQVGPLFFLRDCTVSTATI